MLPCNSQQKLLVYGYINSFTNLHTLIIPMVIYHLCIQFFDDILHEHIKLILCTPPSLINRYETIQFKSTSINNISFTPSLIIDLSTNTIRLSMHIQHHKTIQFIKYQVIIYEHNLTFTQMASYIHTKKSKQSGLLIRQSQLLLDDKISDFNIQCKDINNFDFSIQIVLLSINYQQFAQNRKNYVSNVLQSTQLLKRNKITLSLCDFPLISLCTNNNWVLSVKRSSSGYFCVCLQLLILPKNIHKILVKITTNRTSDHSINTHFMWSTQKRIICSDIQQSFSFKTIIVNIEIEQVLINKEHTIVPVEYWHKYNIVT